MRIRGFIAATLVAVLLEGAGSVRAADTQCPAVPIPASLQTIYEAAKGEGELTLETTEDRKEIDQIFACFTAQFPGISLKYTETIGDISRFIAAAQAGRVSTDVLQLSISATKVLLDRDLVESGDYLATFREIGLPKQVVIDDKLLIHYDGTFPITYNTAAIGSTPLPKSWEDLLKPEYKGKVVIEARAFPIAALGLARGEAAMVEYIRALRAQDVVIAKGGGNVAQQLAAGLRPIAIGVHGWRIAQYQAKGLPLAVIDANPVLDSPTVSLVPKKAPHPNAGKLYAGWLSSPAGQAVQERITHKGVIQPGVDTQASKDSAARGVEFVRLTLGNGDEFLRLSAVAADAFVE